LADIWWRLFHHWARIGKGKALTAPMAAGLQPNQPFRRAARHFDSNPKCFFIGDSTGFVVL
jgi:hypothetical protein